MKSSTTRRLGGALVATLIAVPLTAGVAGAEVTTPPSEASSTSAEQPGDAGPPEGSGPQDADAEADSQTGSVAEAALIFLLRRSVDRANPRRGRMSAGRTGSPLSEVSAPLLSVEQPAPGSSWRSCQGRRTHPVTRG